MKIFFAGSIRGGRGMLPTYIQIIEMLKKQGHTVVSEHVASELLEKIEEKITDEEIFNNDIGYIDECDCLVAEVTTPSIGVGYEIGYAISKGKLVLCIHREDANVSAMVRGNRRIISVPYMNIEDLDNTIELHLPNS
ncbi:MAG: nucleoside 2-deoxyribosyltransferase [Candidatus Methanoperedens sp.]|nr:nucleoside 2-deoxyribosyltransferase [Candidatus Methanoperedens sp.]